MEILKIQPTSLVLLSGPPASGKTTACRDLPSSLVISSDRLRESLFGTAKTLVDGQPADVPMAIDDRLIFATMENFVRARLRAGLTTIVDATLISDKERQPFAAIAEELGVTLQVIIFDLPEAQIRQQNQARRCPVPDRVVTRFIERLERRSRWPYTVVTTGCTLAVDIATIPADQNIDAIGDIHGLADGLRALLSKLGYDEQFHHPEGRKLCFLGDLVDRGPQSLVVLDLVMAAVEQGHYCVRGNHDQNLAQGLKGQPL
ncbi:MAG: AAA family ATPase, partial [Cyanobacteria bacterium P01_D01_bin.36]